jgi:hypothetical protein
MRPTRTGQRPLWADAIHRVGGWDFLTADEAEKRGVAPPPPSRFSCKVYSHNLTRPINVQGVAINYLTYVIITRL